MRTVCVRGLEPVRCARMPSPSDQHAYPAHWEADVVLRDGGTAQIRPITPDDAQRLVSFYEQVSDESKYYRFFAPYPRLSDRDVHRFTHHDYVDRVGLAATVGGEFIATVRYDRIDDDGLPALGGRRADEAEVAFLVQDAHQGRGVASALLEHIAAVARERGIRRFAAEVLPANNKMIKVFTDAGYTQKRSFEDGVVRLDLRPRTHRPSPSPSCAPASSAPRPAPCSGCSPPARSPSSAPAARPGGVGRTVLRNLLDGGFTGRVHAVNHAFAEDRTARPRRRPGPPLRRARSTSPVDLAVVAVPAEQVPEVVADCGEHGVQGLVVLSAGYAESGPEGRERQRELVRQARSYGMRVIGPNAFGIINTAPDVRLNASLSPETPRPGRHRPVHPVRRDRHRAAVRAATGAARAARSLPSSRPGNRADVSGNDLLQYWYDDPDTDVALHVPRIHRQPAQVHPARPAHRRRQAGRGRQGRPAQRQRAPPGTPCPSPGIPDATVSALLRQAGRDPRRHRHRAASTPALLLASQPLPAGPRVAILGNSESLGLLTYDACLTEGLRPLPPLRPDHGRRPRGLPARAGARRSADDACDAVVVTAIPWVGERRPAATEPGRGRCARPSAAARQAGGGGPPGDRRAGGGAGRRGEHRTAGPPSAPVPRRGAAPRSAPAATAAPRTAARRRDRSRRPDAGRRCDPRLPAAERAVRALAEAVQYAQWRRDAARARPGARVRGHRRGRGRRAGSPALARGARRPPRAHRSTARTTPRALLGPVRHHRAARRCPAPGPDAAVRGRRAARLPGRPQDHRPASAPPRRPRRRTPRPRRRGRTAPRVRAS